MGLASAQPILRRYAKARLFMTASFPDRQVIADLTAKMFLEVEAVRFMAGNSGSLPTRRAHAGYAGLLPADVFSWVAREVVGFGVTHPQARRRSRPIRARRPRRTRRHALCRQNGRKARSADALSPQEGQ